MIKLKEMSTDEVVNHLISVYQKTNYGFVANDYVQGPDFYTTLEELERRAKNNDIN